ncbi:MAG: phosphoribosylformylglycinamidine cyclo-ligase [Euryarchaeota archaeon]|nr:phosphoribosylformylglycinamidine cyclo-ligase [Euryarchaeota archaeon]
MEKTTLTYARAGVDIRAKERSIEALVSQAPYRRRGPGRPVLVGHYAGLVDIPRGRLAAITTDGVGTKLLVASALRRWDTVGIDCVAMNVNDLLAIGAEPIAFVDYLALERPDPRISREIGRGLQRGCRQARCTLVGGETAILPDLIRGPPRRRGGGLSSEKIGFDLAGTALGMVDRGRVITGRAIRPGDTVIGLPSSGIHSNGLTLARRILREAGLGYRSPCPWNRRRSLGEELLEPTRIYVPEVLRLIRGVRARGLAHITGSGLLKWHRLTPHGLHLTHPLPPQAIFGFLWETGDNELRELYRTFNMGMGFLAAVAPRDAPRALRLAGPRARVVGEVTRDTAIRVRILRVN